ncbi:unnamed protein product, partial [Laminaria digitata]
ARLLSLPQVNLEDSKLTSNEAEGASGGAISAESGSEVKVVRCTMSGNMANGGGAVYGAGAFTKVVLESSTVSGNKAIKEGGALRAYTLGSLRTDRCGNGGVRGRGGGGGRWGGRG